MHAADQVVDPKNSGLGLGEFWGGHVGVIVRRLKEYFQDLLNPTGRASVEEVDTEDLELES